MKCYLIVLEGQLGTSYQLWYDDDGQFIGCSGQEPVMKYLLPDPSQYGMPTWDITSAVDYYRSLA